MRDLTLGLSFRRGPYEWDEVDVREVRELRFGIWDIPAWMLLDNTLATPYPFAHVIASDLYSYAELSNLAEFGFGENSRVLYDFAISFGEKLKRLKAFGVTAVTLDVGLSDPPPDGDDEMTELRFRLLRVLWQVATRAEVRLLLPIQLPFETDAHARWTQDVMRRAMCTGLKYVADVHVHKILHMPDVPKLLHSVIFDLDAVRLCWDAEGGNVIRPEWFDGWKNWGALHTLTVPVIFEPVQHLTESFKTHARIAAVMGGLVDERENAIPLQ